jgi:hypothetical protein
MIPFSILLHTLSYPTFIQFLINFITLMNKHSIGEVRKERYNRLKANTMTIDSNRSILPDIQRHSTISDRSKNFNKYYITPALRYKRKINNPQ